MAFFHLQGRATNLVALPGSRAMPAQLSPGLWYGNFDIILYHL